MGRRGKHRAAGKTSSELLPRKVTLGVLAASALASGGFALNTSAPANAACAAIGGVGKIGDGSCSATAPGSFAFALFPGTKANATGTNSSAIALGINDIASTGDGTGNHALAIGIGNTASSLLGDENNNTALGINNTASSVGSKAGRGTGQYDQSVRYAATGSNNNNTALGIGNIASSYRADGNKNTASGINNRAATDGSAGGSYFLPIGPNSVEGTFTATGQNNRVTAFGFGNSADATQSNGNDVSATGVNNGAGALGTPGTVDIATTDLTEGGVGTKTVTTRNTAATGNDNKVVGFGFGNTAFTSDGNRNTVIAAGRSNRVSSYGTAAESFTTDTYDTAADGATTKTSTTYQGSGAGNGNRGFALGRGNSVVTDRGNRNDSLAFGKGNTATVSGSIGQVVDGSTVNAATGNRNRLRVFGRNSTATADHVNDRNVTAAGIHATAP